MDNIRVIFILSNECTDESQASNAMIQAYEACKQVVANVSWVKEDQYETIDLNKTDFLIFQDFKGRNFEQLKASKCARILGPWCVLICLMEGRPIPNFPWPIYNVAMDGCTISCSHLSKKVKQELKDKILLMGGCYTETLMSSNTHLITDSVGTEKYVLAAEKGLKIMTAGWVNAVWEASQESNVKLSDAKFDKYICKPFHNLVVSATGLDLESRQVISRLITNNGGSFTGKLNIANTDILICEGVAGTTSAKYKAARNTSQIMCVTAQWVHDSLQKGYALPCNLYPVKKGTSTPTKDDTLNPNFSMMSAITSSRAESRSTLEETVNASTVSNANPATPKKHAGKRKGNEAMNMAALDQLDIKKAKRAGQYLDGCSVYIAGFEFEQKEKLCKILNLSGATRYDDISDRVTHVIVGDPSCHDLQVIKSRGYICCLVSVCWVLESMELQQPANEQKFLVSMDLDNNCMGSPLSKKGLDLLRSNRTITEQDLDPIVIADDPVPDERGSQIMDLYLNPNQGTEEDTLAQLLKNADSNFKTRRDDTKETSAIQNQDPTDATISQPTATCTADDEDSLPLDIFTGATFSIVGFDEENTFSLTEMIESAAGTVVPSIGRKKPNYSVVPVFNTSELNVKAHEVVNNLYITECMQEGEKREIAYYHRPYILKDSQPLEGCVITISGYSSFERSFLNNLIRELGGDAQDQFARITAAEKNIKACTHLVSLEASGKKYAAALKWSLPVVDKDWLLECAKSGVIAPENNYLVGNSKAREINENAPPNQTKTPSMVSMTSKMTTASPQSSRLDPSKKQAQESNRNEVKHHTRTPSKVSMMTEGTTATPQPSRSEYNKNQACESNKKAPSHQNKTASAVSIVSDIHTSTPSSSRVEFDKGQDERMEADESMKTPKGTSAGDKDNSFRTPQRIPWQTTGAFAQNTISETLLLTPRRKGSPDVCSQVTPVNKIMAEVRMSNLLGTPQSPPMPKPWGHVDTPETPLGAFLKPDPSPNMRKDLQRFINQLPDFVPPKPKRLSTPLSELRQRLFDKVVTSLANYEQAEAVRKQGDSAQERSDEEVPEGNQGNSQMNLDSRRDPNESLEIRPLPTQTDTPENKLVHCRIQELENMLTASTEKKRCSRNFQTSIPAQVVNPEMKDSQAFTVGWDYMTSEDENVFLGTRIFMISGVDSESRQRLVSKIEQLGGVASELVNYDPSATHMVSTKPARNEKTLACMAAGKWVLHVSYIEESIKAGKFLPEENFEFGNEKSANNISLTCDADTEARISALHWWRKEISRRGYGAFNDMRAIVVANKRDPIIRVIEAGGGKVVDILPPFDDSVHATHCLLEPRSVSDYSVYFPLAKQGIYCLNTLYISEFLHRTNKDIRDCVLPYFTKFYR